MDDLISRQAAIVALCMAGCDSGYCGASCDDVKAIEQLPSVQPKHTDKRTETHACDLIDRQAAIDAARDWYEGLICGSFKGLEKRLRALTSAQPQRMKGRWEYVDYGGFGNWHCTACRKIAIVNGNENFCPNCGADMRGEEDD